MIRAVYDTNVFLSAILFGGVVFDELMEATLDGRVELVTSPFILNELNRILKDKFKIPPGVREEIRSMLKRRSMLVSPLHMPRIITRKSDDNKILACAKEGQSGVLVTGDKRDLLTLREYCGIHIISPRTLYDMLTYQKK